MSGFLAKRCDKRVKLHGATTTVFVVSLADEPPPYDADAGSGSRCDKDDQSGTGRRSGGSGNVLHTVRFPRRGNDGCLHRGRTIFRHAERTASIAAQIVSVIARFRQRVHDAVSAACNNAIGAALAVRSIGVESPSVTEFDVGLQNAVAAFGERVPLAGVAAIVVWDTVAVITLLAQGGLDDAVAAEAGFPAALRRTAVSIPRVLVVAFLTCFHDAIAANDGGNDDRLGRLGRLLDDSRWGRRNRRGVKAATREAFGRG